MSVKKFTNIKGILKDISMQENDARKNIQTKRIARERNDKITVFTQKKAPEESMAIETESGLEIRELSSSEDSSIEEVGSELNMKNMQSDKEITSTQTTTSEEVLDFDSSASVYIESTQNTSSEEVSLSTTSGLQKNFNVDSPRAKPSSKWENVFYNWTKGYKKSGCDASQCSQCTTEEMNDYNVKTNKSSHDDVNEGSRTPRKKICRRINEGKGATYEHENERGQSNDVGTTTSDWCRDVPRSVELIHDSGKCIRELDDKIQNRKDTSASAIHDIQASVQNSVQEQSEINESSGFDTNDSPDLLTGTHPFDTENIKSHSSTESIIPMPDILTGTQPFDKMSQTQGFVPQMLKTQRSSSSFSNECSFLSPIESDKEDALKFQDSSIAKSLTFTLESGLLNDSGSVLSKALANDLLCEETRLANLSKPTEQAGVEQLATDKRIEQKRKDTGTPVQYRIFREKGRQKSNDDIQIETVDKRNMIDNNEGSTSNAIDVSMKDKNMNIVTDKCVKILSDSSQETISDRQREKNETRIPDTDNFPDEESNKRLSACKQQIISENEEQLRSGLSVDYTSRISTASVTAKACDDKRVKAIAARKPLNLSTIRVHPVGWKQRKDVYKNILCVKWIRKGFTSFSLPYSVKESSSQIEIDAESEFDFEVRKASMKTYEPKKAIIDGHEMGNENMWMNLVKAPYPKSSKLNEKRKHKHNHKEKKKILVRKEVDGVFRFVRIPVQNSSNNSEDTIGSNVAVDTAQVSPSKFTNNSLLIEDIYKGSDLEESSKTVKSTRKDENEFQTNTAENELLEIRKNMSPDSNEKEIMKTNYEDNFGPESSNLNETKISSSENHTNHHEFQAVMLISESNSAKHASSNAENKENSKEESLSRKRSFPVKRKLDKDENGDTNSKIQKTRMPVKENKEVTEKSDLISSGSKTRRQTTIDSFFKDSVKKKYNDGMNLRSVFTQEWIAKQAFECLPSSSEENQKNNPPPVESNLSPGADGNTNRITRQNDMCEEKKSQQNSKDEQPWPTLPTQQPTEIGQKLLTMKLSDDLRQEVMKALQS